MTHIIVGIILFGLGVLFGVALMCLFIAGKRSRQEDSEMQEYIKEVSKDE
ncbi:MAG: DUF3789 domain-containing protein [Clostridiales bacterium]|jgi:hypothetical protein|nr:DUF3789 domain-containing protein [Clostridiales bacterium]